ncbi:MAG: branched-chain amino acid ABC transporter permease [Firmicutes bacterium]|nr:branched-chain amino acid ABC transporter permease [Bacillota bacterium]
MFELTLQAIVSGLLVGGVYALMAAGLNLIFGVVRIINFAHGDLMMVAMYAVYWLFTLSGIDPYVAVLVVAPALFLLGVFLQRVVIRPIQGSSPLMIIFATVAVSLVLQNLALMLFQGDFRSVQTSYSIAVLDAGPVLVSVPRLIAFAASILLFAGLFLFLRYTYVGKALRAVAENRTVARLMGIRVERIYLLAFGLGSALAGIAGVLMMPFASAYPTVGTIYTLLAFVVVVLGGLGSMEGTVVAGLAVGLIETLTGTFISPAVKEIAYFGLFIVILLIRPQGFFGLGKGTEEVGLK